MLKLFCAMMLAMAALPIPASAATIVYRITGLFDAVVAVPGGSRYVPYGPGTFTGIGDTDDFATGIGFSAVRLSSLSVTLGGTTYAALQPGEFAVFPGSAIATFYSPSGHIPYTAPAFASYDPRMALLPVSTTSITPAFSLDTDKGRLNVGPALQHEFSATIVAAVPEPATWGMMIVGLALVGAALRRRGAITLATARGR